MNIKILNSNDIPKGTILDAECYYSLSKKCYNVYYKDKLYQIDKKDAEVVD